MRMLLRLFQEALPADCVVSDATVVEQRYLRNEDEVLQIVSLANAHQIPLYPFSTGKNWGLGSKLPVVDGCVLVDLSRMDRIVEVNEAFAYAIIEPGVTQAHLAAHLKEHHP